MADSTNIESSPAHRDTAPLCDAGDVQKKSRPKAALEFIR
jgi:hypothetical protein